MSKLVISVRGIAVPYSLKSGLRGSMHTTTELKNWKRQVAEAAEDAMAAQAWQTVHGPCQLIAIFDLMRRKTKTKRKAGVYSWAWIDKPDTEPLLRPVKDALTDAGVWKDDCQVVLETTGKQEAVFGAERGPAHGHIGVRLIVSPILEQTRLDADWRDSWES